MGEGDGWGKGDREGEEGKERGTVKVDGEEGRETENGEGALPGTYSRLIPPPLLPDWNTCSDEDALPQLRRVSCASLACLLKHTGLFLYATNCW